MSSPALRSIISWLITLMVPVALILTAVRAMFTPLYLQYEYNAPGFPADRYGFTTQDRLYWSQIALDYLVNDANISFLGDLRFQDGTPVYNERELRHMVDVKNAVGIVFITWYSLLGVLLALGVWAWRGGWWDDFCRGMGRGGWLTVFFIVTILLFVMFAFSGFFVAFHNVFFAPGTWMFNWSDTLIRLFPERFWRDIFIIVGAMSLGGGLALAYFFRRK